MCGITGIASKKAISGRRFYSAHKTLEHRGPDDEGFSSFNPQGDIVHLKGPRSIKNYQCLQSIVSAKCNEIILGHHRLKVADRSSKSHQPMQHQTTLISYNGMLYNYLQLRAELENLGHTFESEGDTEVVLKSFSQWGKKCFEKFNGMWAVALIDSNTKKITLARDRYGVKPLYYSTQEDAFYFSSEIKFIVNFFDKKVLNTEAAYDYTRFGFVDHNDQTFFKDVFSVPASGLIEYLDGNTHKEFYHERDHVSFSPTSKDIQDDLTRSLGMQSVAKVPVGALLSGGIDSSVIVALITKHRNQNLKTFSVGFEETEFSEHDFIKETLKKLRLQGKIIKLNEKKMINALEEVLWHREAPLRSLSTVNQFLLYRHISRKTDIKVVLTGDGSDEIFLGYQNDFFVFLESLLSYQKINRLFKAVNGYKKLHGTNILVIFKKLFFHLLATRLRYSKHLSKRGFKFNRAPKINHHNLNDSILNHQLNSIFNSPLPEYLNSNDRMAMSNSIENRVPFLDNKLVDNWVHNRATELFVSGYSKSSLRSVADQLLPASVARRTEKVGFQSPQELWQKCGQLGENMDKRLKFVFQEEKYDFLDYKFLIKQSMTRRESKTVDANTAWRLYCLDLFVEIWKLEVS